MVSFNEQASMTKLSKQSKETGIGKGGKKQAQRERENVVQEDVFISAVQIAKFSLRKTTSKQERSQPIAIWLCRLAVALVP